MAAVVMMVISLLFIPSAACAFWVAFSIVSIEIGVIGYMSLWSVNLDTISMINLIMCIGFSVDFSAHISYAYINSDLPTPAERVQSALYSLGLPIFQGSISTILGIIALAFAPSYIFLTFFKTVFLVMLFGALHGILLLPVLLSISDSCFGSKRSKMPLMTAPGMFDPFTDGHFTMGVGPPFSKYPPPVMPYPPVAMRGPAFGAIPVSAPFPFVYPHAKNGKSKSKHDQQMLNEAARFAFYRSQFAFLPVGSEINPYAISPTLAGMQNSNLAGMRNKQNRNNQFKHAKLVASNGLCYFSLLHK